MLTDYSNNCMMTMMTRDSDSPAKLRPIFCVIPRACARGKAIGFVCRLSVTTKNAKCRDLSF